MFTAVATREELRKGTFGLQASARVQNTTDGASANTFFKNIDLSFDSEIYRRKASTGPAIRVDAKVTWGVQKLVLAGLVQSRVCQAFWRLCTETLVCHHSTFVVKAQQWNLFCLHSGPVPPG